MRAAVLFLIISTSCAGLMPSAVMGGEAVPHLSLEEFHQLADELAPKVNLFRAVWEENPNAEFYGGTSRDFLYWLKRKFRDLKSRKEATEMMARLRKEDNIDVREFIIGDSDVDVIAKERPTKVQFENYGVKKLDAIPASILDAKTPEGQNELFQGYIPAEKIRIAKSGLVPSGNFGDGVGEIYSGKLSIHFAPESEFAQTKFAALKLNHPILLATRFIRLLGIDYYNSYGKGHPDPAKLFRIAPEIVDQLRQVINPILDGQSLNPFLEKEKFRGWLNGNIQKAFRSYTNPTAALELERFFKIDQLVSAYPNLETINQYVFAKHRNPQEVEANFIKYNIDPETFFLVPQSEFPDLTLYHGTRTEPDFRAILFQGVLPSKGGTAGSGLYGVKLNNLSFAEDWGGDKKRLVGLKVKDSAKIVDINKGPGKEVWEAFQKNNPRKNLEDFAEVFGIDIIKYPYNTEAYVVKNSEALGNASGIHRQLMSYSEARKMASNVKDGDGIHSLLGTIVINSFNAAERTNILRAVNLSPEIERGFAKKMLEIATSERVRNNLANRDLLIEWFSCPFSNKFPEIVDVLLKNNQDQFVAWKVLSLEHWAKYTELLEKVIGRHKADKDIARFVLSQPFWPANPKWVNQLIKNGDANRMLIEFTLAAPHWADHPELVSALIGHDYDRKIAEELLSLPQWKSHPEALEKLLKGGRADEAIIFHTMSVHPEWYALPIWRDHIPLVEKAIRGGSIVDREVAKYILSQPHFADQVEWFEELVEAGTADRQLAQYVFTQPHAKGFGKYVKKVWKGGRANEELEKYVFPLPQWKRLAKSLRSKSCDKFYGDVAAKK